MKQLLTILFAVFLQCSLYSQQSDSTLLRLSTFVKNIQVFNYLYPQEKVYLHFDNTGYFLGETIWFKAYVTAASTLSATSLSRVLYIELLNEEGYIVESRKYRIENGQAAGDIPLTKMGMRSGFYEVRAYTRLMLNWEKETLFSRVFPVFEPPVVEGAYSRKRIHRRPSSQRVVTKREESRPESGTRKVNVSFYPEGGQLVEGISSQVAFKVTDGEGRSLSATGEVRDASGETVSSFSTVHKGMGSFIYTPQTGVPNTIHFTCEGKQYTYPLPEITPSGVVLSVNTLHPDYVQIQVRRSGNNSTLPPLGLLSSCRGVPKVFRMVDFAGGDTYLLRIPRSELPAGVHQVTLFDSSGHIHAERLFFSNTGRSLVIRGEQEKSVYGPLEPVRMHFSCTNDSGVPQSVTFSLSVRDASTEINAANHGNIRTNLLLSSDLKGFVEDADYYLESEDRPHRMALDLLMLTQGWRRYNTPQMIGTKPFEVKHPIEKGIIISGAAKTVSKKKGEEGVDINMWLYSLGDGDFQKGSCPTDTSGNFNFQAEDFFGKYELQLESKKGGKRREYWLTLDRQFAPTGRAYSYWDTYLTASREDTNRNTLWVEDGTPEADSLELLRISQGANLLKNLTVHEKGNWNAALVEKSSVIYDVTEEEERMLDDMSGYNETFLEFLARTSPYFSYDEYDPEINEMRNEKSSSFRLPCYRSPEYTNPLYCTYKGRVALFVVDGTRMDATSYYDQTILASEIEKVYILEKQSDFLKYYYTTDKKGEKKLSRVGNIESENEEAEKREKEQSDQEIVNQGEVANGKDLNNLSREYPIYIPDYSRGAIIVYMQTYEKGIKRRDPIGVRKTNVLGFSAPRAFYNPNYNEFILPDEQDYRRTLYWNPDVNTNSLGKTSVIFYNNSTSQKMNVSAETIKENGISGFYHIEQ